MNNRLINTKVAGGGGGCTDIVDNYDPFDGNGVALYQLNGNANDVSGNYNGTASNVTWGGAGVFGTSAAFNGSSSIITLGQIIPINSDLDFSFSQWINPASLPSSGNFTTIWGTPGSNIAAIRLIIRGVSGGFEFELVRGLNSQIYYSSNTSSTLASLSTGVWYNLTFTYVSSTKTIKFYLNGVELGNGYTLDVITSFTIDSGLALGVYQGTISSTRFNGSIDQVRIFNTALDPLEVEALYTEELCICDGTVDTLDILGDGSCIATYQLDGNANDLSGNYSGQATDVSYGVGEFDLAGVFNGSTSGILLNNSPFTNTQSVSVCFWLKNVVAPTSSYDLIYQGDGNDYFYISVNTSGEIEVYPDNYLDPIYPRYTTPLATTNSNITDGSWHHIVVLNKIDTAANGGGYKIYVDGQLNASASFSSSLRRDSGGASLNSSIGVGNTGDYAYYDGELDQVRIFNKALNSTEVGILFNDETPCN